MRLLRHFLLCLAFVLPGGSLPAAPPTSFQVSGAVLKPGVWNAARLRHDLARNIKVVAYTLKGKRHTAHAVPLWAILQIIGPRINPKIKNHALRFVVIVSGQDGYAADFSLAELSPDFGHRAVWVALDQDGRSLGEEAGPAQLLVPQDVKPARWVHGVASITLVDMTQTPASGGY